MIALADCNTFFASVEKVFHPGLRGKPVCVLSSNDGNIVALTAEAKALGIRRGDPLFQVKETVEKNHVAIFSGNLVLYNAMSRRVQGIMRQFVEKTEAYSIDEQFLYLDGYERNFDLVGRMREMVETIRLWTDIPVSVGIAPSKTLAKVASKFAKKYSGYRSVCIIDSESKRRKALEIFELDDVWGLGRRSCEKLRALGVHNPLEFADKTGSWVERHFHKPGYQTWLELNGHPCIDTEEIVRRERICTSRSFGTMVSTREELRESVASFAASCANTLRSQGSCAGAVSVFVMSNRFREDLPQYANFGTVFLPVPSADTLEITRAALEIADSIYRPGILFKKSGVVLSRMSHGVVQPILFDSIDNREEREQLSRTIDSLNHRFGLKAVKLAAEGDDAVRWKVKSGFRTPDYLTNINELMTINI